LLHELVMIDGFAIISPTSSEILDDFPNFFYETSV